MAVNHTYDELAGHRTVVAPMVETRAFWRSTLLGAYIELVSVMMRSAVAACEGGASNDDVEGIVTFGDIVTIEPWGTAELIQGLLDYNYMVDAGPGVYRLQRYEKLVHWKRPQQVAWEKLCRKETADPKLKAQVRYRDGDQCRVCHAVVKWGAKAGDDLRGTLDHKYPGVPADGNPDMLAVTCTRCNGIRSNRADANDIAPWQDAPEKPFYTENTAKYLRVNHGYAGVRKTGRAHLLPHIEISARPVAQPTDPAPRDPAYDRTPRTAEDTSAAPQGPSPARPATQADTAPATPARPATAADTAHPRDPAASGTPRTANRPQTDVKPVQNRETTSLPPDPIPRTNQPDEPTPPTGKGRGGTGRSGESRPARRRGRRGRNKHVREDQP
ncbi:hypothetical protein RN607_00635 [Demequina capsici]|uniref:HNH endonuclease n=1 Tax=Demequina capsici TaxID=3075620 RepID=A0AA96JG41_9MICO|nr:hypothetical protein [Demequina sp. PMTSA13]WNM27539.1 hypothetical protein RN607_00635 [Demequina sp. PMTSA13]